MSSKARNGKRRDSHRQLFYRCIRWLCNESQQHRDTCSTAMCRGFRTALTDEATSTCCFWAIRRRPSRSSSSLLPRRCAPWNLQQPRKRQCNCCNRDHRAANACWQAPIAVYTSGKGSSAAGLTASVIRDANTGEFYLEVGARAPLCGVHTLIMSADTPRRVPGTSSGS